MAVRLNEAAGGSAGGTMKRRPGLFLVLSIRSERGLNCKFKCVCVCVRVHEKRKSLSCVQLTSFPMTAIDELTV